MTKNTGYRANQRAEKEKLKEFGEIYLVTCVPTGKKYVGQAVLLSGSDLRPYGTYKRWKSHIYEAFHSMKTCRHLNFAINKYGEDAFIVEPILTCKLDKINEYEIYFIKYYNTLVPNGYNLQEGGKSGRASEETKKRISDTKKGEKHHQFGIPVTDETKEKIRQTNIDNAIRVDRDGISILPKYLKYVNWSSETGYHIVSHPLCKQRKFVTTATISDLIINEKKQEAINFLNSLNASVVKTT